MAIPTIHFQKLHMTMPFRKNSPYFELLNEAMIHINEKGSLQQIMLKYQTPERFFDTKSCDPPQTSLGFSNTFLPFVLLGGSAFLSLLVFGIENMFHMSQPLNHMKTESSVELTVSYLEAPIKEILKIIMKGGNNDFKKDYDKMREIRFLVKHYFDQITYQT